jgi:hypothetical protein
MDIEFTQEQKDLFQAAFNGDADAIMSATEEAIRPLLEDFFTMSLAFSEENRKPIVRALLDRGYDPNLVHGKTSLLGAAIYEDNCEIAELLLQYGANPNQQREIISALNRNDISIRKRLVRLLVEHGCDVNQVYDMFGEPNNLFTALDWAQDMQEVSEYLRSKGAKTAAELGVMHDKPDKPATLSKVACVLEVLGFVEQNFGDVAEDSFRGRLPGAYTEVHIVPATEARKHITLFTTGLSSQPMQVPPGQDEWKYAELYIQLPHDWPIDQFQNPAWNWPIVWLHKLANYPLENATWLGGPMTFVSHEEPPRPLATNTGMSCLMLMANKSFTRSDGETVQLYQVTPIYADERELELREGLPVLMKAFDRADVPLIVDIQRKSVV